MDPIHQLIGYIRRTGYEDLPRNAVEVAKKAIVDTVGAGLAGSATPLGRMLAEMAFEAGGSPQSSTYVYGKRIPVQEAAFLNGVFARCAELDDVHEGTKRLGGGVAGHVNSMIVPAALAFAETIPTPVSGKDLITAVAIGADIIIRMRTAAGTAGKLGFMAETVGPFGAAATCAKLLGLNEDEIANAMGAAYTFCSGTTLSNADGAWDIWLPSGNATRAGVTAVNLARRGYVGSRFPLSGVAGLYNLYFRDEFHEKTLLGDLGREFEIANVSIKPYSACKCTHNAIYTALQLKKKHGIRSEDIERIAIRTCSWNVKLTVVNEKGEHKHAPRSLNDALFSMPFVVATALAKGDVFPNVLSAQSVQDPDIVRLSRKITVTATPEMDEYMAREGFPPDEVEIHMKDGQVHTGAEAHAIGHPANPMSFEQVVEKFYKCAKFAASPVPPEQLAKFVGTIAQLERQDDVRGLGALLSCGT